MKLTISQLHNLPVETQSGRALGRVVDVEIEPGQQEIRTYHVRSRAFIPGLFEQKLLIDRGQVVRLTPTKLIVEDGVAAGTRLPQPEPDAPASV